MQNFGTWSQFIIIFLLVGFSVLQWVVRKLAEQRERQRELQKRQHHDMEVLRTGRAPQPEPGQVRAAPKPSAQDERQRRLQEIAARRQAQLEELRRRRQEQLERARVQSAPPDREPRVRMPDGVQQRPQPSAGPARSPAPPRPGVPARPSPQRAPSRQQQPARGRQPQPVASTRQSQRSRPLPSAKPAAVTEMSVAETEISDELRRQEERLYRMPESVHDSIDEAPGQASLGEYGPFDLRQAVLYREVLGAPVGIRSPETGPGSLNVAGD